MSNNKKLNWQHFPCRVFISTLKYPSNVIEKTGVSQRKSAVHLCNACCGSQNRHSFEPKEFVSKLSYKEESIILRMKGIEVKVHLDQHACQIIFQFCPSLSQSSFLYIHISSCWNCGLWFILSVPFINDNVCKMAFKHIPTHLMQFPGEKTTSLDELLS